MYITVGFMDNRHTDFNYTLISELENLENHTVCKWGEADNSFEEVVGGLFLGKECVNKRWGDREKERKRQREERKASKV